MSTSQVTETAINGSSQIKPISEEKDIPITRAWLLMGLLTAVTTVVAFARNKLAAVLLGPGGVGVYAQGMALLTFGTTLCTLGMGQGIVKHLAERKTGSRDGITRSQIIRTALVVQLGVASAVALMMILLSKPLSHSLFGDSHVSGYVVIVGAAIPLTVLFTNLGYFLQGFKKLNAFTLASAANVLIGLVVFATLIWSLRLNGALLGLLGSAATGVLVFLLFSRGPVFASAHRERFEIGESRSPKVATLLLKYGTVVFVSGVLETLTALLLRTWIVNFRGAVLNGVYQAVLGLSGQYIGFFVLFNNSYLYPKLSSLRSAGESNAEINHALRTGLLLSVPLVAGVIIFRRELILLLFTRDFLPAADVLMWQAIGDVLKIISWFISASLLPTGRLREFIGLSAIYSIIYVGLSFTFLRKWNLIGLAIAYCLSYAFYLILVTGLQRKLIRLSFSPATLTILIASAALLFCMVWIPQPNSLHYALKIGLMAVWFMIVCGWNWTKSAMASLGR